MSQRITLLYWLILLQAFVAFTGSLIFSNYLGYAHCDLCWYQRIAMYPQMFIAGAALIRKDVSAVWYGLPLALAGLAVGIFHGTIYILQNYTGTRVAIECSVNGVSCTVPYLIWGIPVPFLSLGALLVTTVCYLLLMKKEPNLKPL